jgi:ABC-type uncharacterized transport system involved in gliding motility auxiliary subunit
VRILREWGAGFGALIAVLGLILDSMVPEHHAWAMSIAGVGGGLFVAGVILNRGSILTAMRGRTVRAASASVGYSLTVFAVVILANFLATRHHARLDLTENRQFSLSEQTVKVLEGLARDVSITSFSRETDPGYQKLKDLLEEFTYRTHKLTVRFVDPDTNPGEVKRYNITELGTIVIESGKQETRINTSDEEALTNALIKVTSDRERVVYFITGHGEHDVGDNGRDGLSALKGVMEKQNYAVKPLVLNQGVPQDAAAVVVAGARKPYLDAEVTMIDGYLERGGRLFLGQDPGADPGFAAILAKYGVAVRKDVIIDKVSQLFGGDARIPMVAADGYDRVHPITKTFNYQTMYPMASSLDVKEPAPAGVTATKLAHTSELSWGETSEEEFKSGHIKLDEGVDTRGPLTIAAAFERKGTATAPAAEKAADAPALKEPQASRIVLFGDADFMSNNYFNAGGNGDLALSGVAWLVEQGELISIRPKTSTPQALILTPAQVAYYLWTMVALAPLAIAATGVAIWWRRKRL